VHYEWDCYEIKTTKTTVTTHPVKTFSTFLHYALQCHASTPSHKLQTAANLKVFRNYGCHDRSHVERHKTCVVWACSNELAIKQQTAEISRPTEYPLRQLMFDADQRLTVMNHLFCLYQTNNNQSAETLLNKTYFKSSVNISHTSVWQPFSRRTWISKLLQWPWGRLVQKFLSVRMPFLMPTRNYLLNVICYWLLIATTQSSPTSLPTRPHPIQAIISHHITLARIPTCILIACELKNSLSHCQNNRKPVQLDLNIYRPR